MKKIQSLKAYPVRGKTNKIWLIMKAIFIFLFIGMVQVSGSVYSQQTRLTLKLEDVSVADLIKEIKQISEFDFVYDYDVISSLQNVSVNVNDASVEEILDKCLQNSNLDYKIQDKVILIVPGKNEPEILIPQQPKTITISGKVTDERGEPLPFVNIYIKGDNTQGVVTDQEGNYSITVEEREGLTLVASFIGFVTKEFAVEGRTVINLMLKADIADLGEVVVTGYQSISSERAAGSFKNVNVDKLLEQKTSDNVLNIIEGEVTGLLFEEPGSEGGTPEIVLRGVNNFDSTDPNSLMPLVVIDGFPINGVSDRGSSWGDDFYQIMQNLNPTDIENVSVLKDAAAASIWGAQAANGVIVITTKKGSKSEKPKFTFSSSLSFKAIPDYKDTYSADMETLFELEEWYANNRMRPVSDYNTRANSEGAEIYYAFSKITDPTDEDRANRDAAINELRKNDFIQEYTDLFLRRATQQQYAFSVNQGSDKYNYFASLKYNDQQGTYKRDGSQDYSALINLSTNIAKGIKFSTKLSYAKKDVQSNSPMPYSRFSPYARILGDDGEYLDMIWGTHQSYKDKWESEGNPYSWHYNVKEEHELSDDTREVRNSVFQAKLDLDLIKGLKAELSYNYQHGSNKNEEYQDEKAYDVRRDINRTAIYVATADSDRPWIKTTVPTGETFLPQGGILNGNRYESWSNDYRAMLNYSAFLDAAKEHYVTAIAGIDYREENKENRTFEELFGYDPQSLDYTPVDKFSSYTNWQGSTRSVYTTEAKIVKDRNRYLSNYINASYSLKDKYTLTGSWRLDDSNLFGSSSKYRNVPLWSIGAKWRLARENFINLPILNRLDVRVSYGTGGRIDRDASPFLTIKPGNDKDVPSNSDRSVKDFKNKELRWETTTTINAGIDFALLNNRLSGTIEYYSRYSKDVLGNAPVNHSYGIQYLTRNYGEISNKGFELTLNGNVYKNNDLRWDMSLLMSHNKNMVERYDREATMNTYTAPNFKEGYADSEFYAVRWAGLSETGTAQVYDKDGNIKGINDDLVTYEDLVFMGQATPKYFGSYRNSVSYKGLTLDLLLTYKFGHKFVRNTFGSDALNYGTLKRIHEDAAKRWKKPGDEEHTDVPALSTSYSSEGRFYEGNGDHLVEDASHIRIQSLGLNYRFNDKLFQNNFIEGLSMGVNARNLGLLWKATDKDIDPEYGNYQGTLRNNRATYSFNLKVNF